ncbi:hypothetical protein [Amycolatopsis taiwanensis]|uniref:LppX_LprAFG lipoprotein n=1 Tax=Amycolatopsis taiwanensis TaxID=342230 RepID=A0A9W6QXU6_9PSEU|nr:hypothetical protein [Amycolatopsis taiwanensis]GLY64498.1 hypothetical protein Atai01_11170 [Amycolatopsis taiwanensis]
MKKAILAVSGLALVVTISACGARPETGQAPSGGSDSLFGNAQELVRAASAKTDQAQSTKFTLTETLGSMGKITAHGEGRFGADPVMDMKMNVLGGPQSMEMEMRLVDKTFYIKVPPEQSAKTGGKPWGRVVVDEKTAKAMGDVTQTAEQNDPTKILDQIQQAGTITKSEKTTLDGQPASHYWVDIDFAKAATLLADSSGLSAEEVQELAKKQLPPIPMELWLNQDSLPMQITEDLSPLMKAAGAPESLLPISVMMNYSDWGTPVDVQAPPANQVGEFKPDAK